MVAEFRERAVAGEPQESLIGWLASLVKGLSIKMHTDKCTAPQFLDLPPGSAFPVVIERGMLRVQFDIDPGRIILSRGRRGGGSRLCAECNGAVKVLFELLAKSPTFLAATGFRLRRGLLCVDDVCLEFQTLERGRYYTIGFRHPNFHPMVTNPPGVWNIQSVDLASGVATAAGLQGIPRQAAYNREDLVRLVSSQDVRRRGIRVEGLKLISRRALDDAKAAIAGKPVPRLLASREWVFNTSFNYGFVLCSRRPDVCPDVLYASPLLHRVRQLIYSRHLPQQVQSARYQNNSLRAFLCPSNRSDFPELFPEFAPCFAMYEILARIKRTEQIFSFSNKSPRDIIYDFVFCPEYVVLYLRALDITRMHAVH